MLLRKLKKIFAKDSASIGVFGSAAALDPQTTTDPETLESLSTFLNGWGSATQSGNRLPTIEDLNALKYDTDYHLAYIYQDGMQVYNDKTEYFENNLVRKENTGEIWKSLIDDNIGNDLVEGANWTLLGDISDIAPATTSTKGVSLLPQQITISNNSTDSEHDLDFTAGNAQAINGSSVYRVEALTKRIDATWVAGTNQGGMDIGPPPTDAPIYCYNIQNLTTGVGDVLYTTSVPNAITKAYTGANMPSGWGNEDYIGACHTDGSANLHRMTWYFGNRIYRASYNSGSKVIALNTTTPSSSIANIKAYAPANSIVNITASVNDNESTTFAAIFFDKGQDDVAPTTDNADLTGDEVGSIIKDIQVGSDGNIRYRANDTGVDYFVVKINGWQEYL